MNTSFDGCIADKDDDIQWGDPSDEVFAYMNELDSKVETMLFGRKMYEIMAVWDNFPADRQGEIDFANHWKSAKKIVYSKTLKEVATTNTSLEHEFDPGAIRTMVDESDGDVSIAGPKLAAEAIKAGIVDEFHQYIVPLMFGSGKYWLPQGAEAKLKLIEARPFDSGTVLLRYAKA
jgi:dihydrofolate reductase